jgi:hypothetical protein
MMTRIGILLHVVLASAQAAGPDGNPPDGMAGTWEVREVAVDHQDQVLLILQRRLPDAKPVPSFDCGKAATPTEKAICSNFDLASWDRSVALALHQAIARNPEKEASFARRAARLVEKARPVRRQGRMHRRAAVAACRGARAGVTSSQA